jgi:serine/threonine-protein kinase RsbW
LSAARRRSPGAGGAPRTGAPHARDAELVLDIPSDVARVGELVERVARHALAHHADPHIVRFNLRVALGEALVNAILHGNHGDPTKQVAVRVVCGRQAIELEVRDEGDGFDPDAVPDPTTPERVSCPGGRGIFLVRQLVDEVRFNAKGNAICLILRRS